VLVRDDAGGLTRGWGEVGRDPAMWMDKGSSNPGVPDGLRSDPECARVGVQFLECSLSAGNLSK
jgi:hypothetical protein